MHKRLTPEEFAKLARQTPRDERVPYAFEKRIMANLSPAPAVDPLSLWTRALWRAVAPCLAIMVITAALSLTQSTQASHDLELALENAVLTPPESSLDFEP